MPPDFYNLLLLTWRLWDFYVIFRSRRSTPKRCGAKTLLMFLREKLFDYIDVVVAPVLIGGKETASLIDGSSIISENELSGLGVLKLIDCTILNDSYIRVRYQVIS